MKGREKRKEGSNSSERAAAGETQFTPGGKRERTPEEEHLDQ